jgi:dipeptidyl-peptidase 4
VLTLEDVGRFPKAAGLGSGSAPTMIAFSPGDLQLTFLMSQPGQLSRTLQQLELATGAVTEVLKGTADEASYSAEEKMRRERMRLLHTGVTQYEWAEHGERVLIPMGGRVRALSPSRP